MDIHVGGKIDVAVVLVPANAGIRGTFLWTVTPTGHLQLFPASDGRSCKVVGAAVGVGVITCEVDKNQVGPVALLTKTLSYNCLAALPPSLTDFSFVPGPEVPNI